MPWVAIFLGEGDNNLGGNMCKIALYTLRDGKPRFIPHKSD